MIDAYAAMLRISPSSAPESRDRRTCALSILPNPVTNEASIRFRLPAGDPVTLAVHDAGGRLVRTLLCRTLPEGDHVTSRDSRDESGHLVPAEVYFSVLRAPGSTEQRRVLVLH